MRWIDLALMGLLGLFIVNQYPMWGTNDSLSVAINFQVAYLLAGGIALALGAGLYVWATTTERIDREIPLALAILGGGLYVHYSLMVLAQRELGVEYASVAAPVATLLALGLVLSARWGAQARSAASP